MRFNRVRDSLGELVPHLQRVVLTDRDELIITCLLDASDNVLVRRLVLEVALTHHNILVDVRLLLGIFSFPLASFSRCRFHHYLAISVYFFKLFN